MQTHELARLLLSMPDAPAVIEMPGYDGDGRLIEVSRVNIGEFVITAANPPHEYGEETQAVLIA